MIAQWNFFCIQLLTSLKNMFISDFKCVFSMSNACLKWLFGLCNRSIGIEALVVLFCYSFAIFWGLCVCASAYATTTPWWSYFFLNSISIFMQQCQLTTMVLWFTPVLFTYPFCTLWLVTVWYEPYSLAWFNIVKPKQFIRSRVYLTTDNSVVIYITSRYHYLTLEESECSVCWYSPSLNRNHAAISGQWATSGRIRSGCVCMVNMVFFMHRL